MRRLNYHHLRLFQAVAQGGGVTAAAAQLNIAPSAVSTQLRALETELGHALFARVGRRLVLTAAGRMTLEAAAEIFGAGEALLARLEGAQSGQRVLRVGALPVLSRNFQLRFLMPVLQRPDVALIVRSGQLAELLMQLDSYRLDVVLANVPVQPDETLQLHCHLLATQRVSLVGHPARRGLRFPQDLADLPLLLPGRGSEARGLFDRLMAMAGITPRIAGEIDDMTMLRLLARETDAVALVPPVVVRDELESGVLAELCEVPGLVENFYAIVSARRFPDPLVDQLIRPADPAPL